jgi:hypothetical protein
LTESQAAVILKRTRKAELLSESSIKVESSANDLEIAESLLKSAIKKTDTAAIDTTAVSPSGALKSPPLSASLDSLDSAATATELSTGAAASSADGDETLAEVKAQTVSGPMTDAATSADSAMRRQSTANLDELLAKLKKESGTVRILPAKHERDDSQLTLQSPISTQEAPAGVSVTLQTPTSTSRQSFIWNGRVNMLGVGFFNGTARQVGGREIESDFEWEELLPAVLSIDGRIPPDRVHPYLQNMIELGTHDTLLIEFSPDDQAEFRVVYDYFHSKQRYAVIGNRFVRVKDMYLVPVAKEEPLPPFLSSLEHRLAVRQRPADTLLGVMVVNRKNGGPSSSAAAASQPDQKRPRVSSSSTYTPAPQQPSMPPAVMRPSIPVATATPIDSSHIQNLLNTLMPAATTVPVQQMAPPHHAMPGGYHQPIMHPPYGQPGAPMQQMPFYGGPQQSYYPGHMMRPPQRRGASPPPRGERKGGPGGGGGQGRPRRR